MHAVDLAAALEDCCCNSAMTMSAPNSRRVAIVSAKGIRMRRCRFLVGIALLISALSAIAQDQSGPRLPSGLRIPATLKASLSSQKAKPGDTIKLDVFSAVHGKDGKVAIPAHATLTGTVTQASAFHGADHPAILAFAVQRAEWKGGQGMLDAPVFGVLALSDFKQTGFAAIGPKDEY